MKEEIFKISRKNYIGGYILGGLFCWTIIVPIVVILYIEIKVRTTEYIIDSKSLTYKYKFLSVQEKKISKKDITDVSMTQDLFQRYFNVGNVHVNTAGSNAMEMVLTGIEYPDEAVKLLK